jgi:ubiquitin-conjugating enzyme E2 G2
MKIFFQELCQNPPEGIVAGPVNEENFFEWESLITGKIYSIYHK